MQSDEVPNRAVQNDRSHTGTGTAGTIAPTAGTSSTPAAIGGSTGSTPVLGTGGVTAVTPPTASAGTVAASSTGGTYVPPTTSPSSGGSSGCSVADGSTGANNAGWFLVTAGLVFLRRRRASSRIV